MRNYVVRSYYYSRRNPEKVVIKESKIKANSISESLGNTNPPSKIRVGQNRYQLLNWISKTR